MGYIYKVTNSVNGKMYIGQTQRSINERWKDHVRNSRCETQSTKSLLYEAIKKYGVDSFTVEEVEQCDDCLLNEREIYWIAHYNTTKAGYNIAKGGYGYVRDPVPVVQFDLDGNYIKTFPSAIDAAREIGSLPQGVYSVCDGYYSSLHGYQWRYLPDAEKSGMKLKKVKEQPPQRPVHQYTMDGDYIASYDSINGASRQLFGLDGSCGIRSVCIGRNRHSHGYRWSYDKVDKLPPIRPDKGIKRVIQMDTDGNVLRTFESISEAANSVGYALCSVSAACNGRLKTCAGYKWKYE